MLTDGGENAEAYFSFDGQRLILQSTRPPFECDQIFTMNIDGSDQELVSTGTGRTTCSYFFPDGEHILYASTHLGGPECPPKPDHSRGYVWPLYDSFDIFKAKADGSAIERLTDSPGYDAEATISPRSERIVFTSVRDGDLDIYTMNFDGSDVQRLTDELGYDGGPFYSPDGSKIVYRAMHPTDPEEIKDYTSLLNDGLIRPSKLEVWVMDADGSNKKRITDLDVAAFAPFFHPSGEKIIFSSNFGDPAGREFELFMVDLDGNNLEQITFSEDFDGFPMWAPDGKTFVFCSNRNNSKPGETNVFVTTWKD
jgi:Tol biopolymer transport system component